jgi:hypothetical protein
MHRNLVQGWSAEWGPLNQASHATHLLQQLLWQWATGIANEVQKHVQRPRLQHMNEDEQNHSIQKA